MKARLKRLLTTIGYHLVQPQLNASLPDPRTSPAAKAAMVGLSLDLQSKARAGDQCLPRLSDSGFRVFSQFEEDGYLVYLAAVLELEPKIFLDIGAADGINSNCANLALNLGWHGLFVDGDGPSVERGQTFYASHPDTSLYPPMFRHAFVSAENINDIVSEAGFSGSIGICSIDVDGNDCWIWKALDIVNPAVVVIETHVEFGMQNIAVPYDPAYRYPGRHADYHGASPVAMHNLAVSKGYRLVGANRFGFNLIFVRDDVFPDRVPSVSLDSLLRHRRYAERLKLFEPISDWEYVGL